MNETDYNFSNISKRIRTTRIERGITQENLASAVHVNTSHICNIENNRVKVSLVTLINISKALDVTVDYLLADQYPESSGILDKEILLELKNSDENTKETILKILKILNDQTQKNS